MKSEEAGGRIKTLEKTMEEITSVYQLGNSIGMKAVNFINAKPTFKKIRVKNWKKCLENIKYDGVTPIGTSLKTKILKKFVWDAPMTKPLVVVIITDGEVSFRTTLLH